MNWNKNNKFNIKYYNLNKYNYPKGTSLVNIIKQFWWGNIDNIENENRYLLILKFKLSNGKWVTLHRATMVIKDTFVNWQLSFKYRKGDNIIFDESNLKTIAFEFIPYIEYLKNIKPNNI